MDLIKQGAEARLYLYKYNEIDCIVKERFIKKYRHPELDAQITKERMKAESKAITRCSTIGILTPKLLHMDLNERKLYIEYIPNSITVKEFIKNQHGHGSDINKKLFDDLCDRIGVVVAKMHLNHIIHGDLTTSNMLIKNLQNPEDPENSEKAEKVEEITDYDLILIDFGLSHYSQSLEDKGVDLYVLERALLSTHSDLPELFSKILDSYKQNYENCNDIITKFEEVRARGRKRTMIG